MPFTPPTASHPWLTSVERPLNATYQSLQKELSVLFGCMSLPRQNKASLVIQSRHSLAPSSESIPTRRIIIRQGQQLINVCSNGPNIWSWCCSWFLLPAGSSTLSSLPPPFPLVHICLKFGHLLIFPISPLNCRSYLFVVWVHTPSENRWFWEVQNSLVSWLVHHVCTASTFLSLKMYFPANYPHPQQAAVVIPLSEAGPWTMTT